MNSKITCRNCQHTPDLDAHIQEQFKRIESFLEKERLPQNIEVVVEMHPKHQHHLVTIRLDVADHKYFAQHEGTDVFAEINEVFDRIYAQLRDRKEQHVDKQKHGCDGECRAKFYEDIENLKDDDLE